MDGEIDYSKYSRDDLNEALGRIDKQRYPQNYANLLKESASRPVVSPAQSSGPRRPVLVKVILVIYSTAIVLTGLVVIMVLITWPATKEPLRQIPTRVWVEGGIGLALTLSAMVLLFRMKRSAFYFCVAGSALATVGNVGNLVSGMPISSVLTPTVLFGYILSLLVSYYTWSLSRQNVLT